MLEVFSFWLGVVVNYGRLGRWLRVQCIASGNVVVSILLDFFKIFCYAHDALGFFEVTCRNEISLSSQRLKCLS